ncbi:MAG: hypothetical protein AAFX99_10525 [Myxococcota bacterium]
MFVTTPAIRYQHHIEGTWGEFSTPAGRVAYILTKARLGRTGTDKERRLTAQLRPVREVLNPKDLNFNQLLQRDLDDHRVATKLLPYLLKPKATGPAFFPPIVTVLLPFEANVPNGTFDTPETLDDLVTEDGIQFQEIRYGQAFRVRRLATEQGLHSIKLGRLGWNDEEAKLVVLDGQHRAMALIAVDRTINKTWDIGAGTSYRHFYEHRVRELLKDSDIELDKIEIPVTVCWFPDLAGPGTNPHLAARKIFVDVNKEARQPSEARLILLSDTELLNIFTRCLLNRLRDPAPSLPIFAIEYDNPDKDAARPVRWSVLTNLNLLKSAVQNTLFCRQKYLTNMKARFGGRPPWDEMNERMRDQLNVQSLFTEVIEDGERTIQRADIGNEHFPMNGLDELRKQFMDSWGSAILTVLGGLLPYKAHCDALEELNDNWLIDDAMASLANEAIFVGVGMYWTLRSSASHWHRRVEERRKQQLPIPHKPDIVKAWDIIDGSKRGEFTARRALAYLGRASDSAKKDSEDTYGIMNTHACQLGVLLALTTLVELTGCRGAAIATLAEHLVEAWNAALASEVNTARDRRLIFARHPTIRRPINLIGKMDTPLAVYFRYFWLQLLLLPDAQTKLAGIVEPDVVGRLVSESRAHYLDYLTSEGAKALRPLHPDWSPAKRQEKARPEAIKNLKAALVHWFEMNNDEVDAWLASLEAGAGGVQSELPDDAASEDNGEEDDGGDTDSMTVDQLLKNIEDED